MKSARWFLFPMIIVLGACSVFDREGTDSTGKESEPAKGPELVGRIASVSSDRRFVLIQSYGPWKREAGVILTARGEEERVANLLVTGESMGGFAAADIQSGMVATGDGVYSLHMPSPPESDLDPAGNPGTAAEEAGNQ